MKRHPVCASSVAVALGVTVGLGALPPGSAVAEDGPQVVTNRADREAEPAVVLPEPEDSRAWETAGGDPQGALPAVQAWLTEASDASSAAKAAAEDAARRAEQARLQLLEAQRRHEEAVAALEEARQRVSALATAAFRPSPTLDVGTSTQDEPPSYPALLAAQRDQLAAAHLEAETSEQVKMREAALSAAEAERDDSQRRYRTAQLEEQRARDRLAGLEQSRHRRITTSRAASRAVAPRMSVLSMPVEGRKSSDYGYRRNPYSGLWRFHAGVDIAAPGGTPIRAAADGTVTRAGWSGGYGNYTCLAHQDGLSTCYAHQSQILVRPGQRVRRDEVIGRVGTTGASTGNHLHFEVRRNGEPTDPLPYLPSFD